MVNIPEDEFKFNDLTEWYKAKEELNRVKTNEMLLRMRIFRHLFKDPKEGTNTVSLDPLHVAEGHPASGHVMKATHVIGRDVDEALLIVLEPEFQKAGIKSQDLIKRKPTLAVAEYRKLTEEQQHLFDQCLTIKPGTPGLEIVLPKKKG